jgi:hypothetical protein
MNKGSKTQRHARVKSILSLSVCCLLFFSGCGLDEYYVVSAPTVVYNQPTYNTTDYSVKYFDFQTNDTANDTSDSSFKYLGTAVYYKIFNNYSTMASAYSAIVALNSSTTYSAAADKMIDSYGYRELSTKDSGTPSPLIGSASSNRRIYIRLMNYLSGNFTAKIIVDWDGQTDSLSAAGTYVPRRNVSGKYTFDFGRTSSDATYSKIPDSSDSDVNYSSSFSDDAKAVWYVDMFAVAVGRDTTYTKYYSKVLHLGSVAIDSTLTDN